VVLSACSTYFDTILSQYEEKDPIVIMRDVKFSDIKVLVEFMYKGEINIDHVMSAGDLFTSWTSTKRGGSTCVPLTEGKMLAEGHDGAVERTPAAGLNLLIIEDSLPFEVRELLPPLQSNPNFPLISAAKIRSATMQFVLQP
ncbi:unnamed protein product, partial [Heterotrigona itama]